MVIPRHSQEGAASVGLRSGSQLVGDAVIPIPTIDL
jgi:hypothetical protein